MTSRPDSSEPDPADRPGLIERLHRGIVGDVSARTSDDTDPGSDEQATVEWRPVADTERQPVAEADRPEADDESDTPVITFDDPERPHPVERHIRFDEVDDRPTAAGVDDAAATADTAAAATDSDADDWQAVETAANADEPAPESEAAVEVADANTAATSATPPSVANALAAELAAGTVDEEAVAILASHFDRATSERLAEMNRRVGALEAFVDALETQLVTSVADAQLAAQVADVADRVERVERGNRDALLTISDEVDRLASVVEAEDAEAATVAARLTNLERWQRNLGESLAAALQAGPGDRRR
ncbi:hypothetical protein [Haloarchaeobius sp. DFWS5]|uniref:hypothetical protein n=1 Tax=Haloarchaeobius sp. DFWS5 TaxID=3446114 RepID=UPI003EB9D2D5